MPALELLTGPRDSAPVEIADAATHPGPIAVLRAPSDTPFAELALAAERAETVVVAFPAFRDGRGLTLAARLRERGWSGRLEAEGHVLPDQARHLARCGFDAVRLGEGAVVADWRRMLASFSAVYQPDEEGSVPVWSLRAAR